MPTITALDDARTALRRFARATNLMLSGRTFIVIGDDDSADAVRTVMLACGGRESSDSPDYAFVTAVASEGEGSASASERAVSAGATVVVDLNGATTRALTERMPRPVGPGTAPARPGSGHARHGVRDGILSVEEIDLVPSWPELPMRAELPDAAGRLEWAGAHMPLAASFAADLKNGGRIAGRRIAVSMVLEPKTAVLALLLRDAGADVVVFAHRYETDDDVAGELRSRGIPVFADSSGDSENDRRLALQLLDTEPELLLDDGAHVIRLAQELRPHLAEQMIGAAEETTSGVRALRDLEEHDDDGRRGLRMPVVAVNDAVTKTRFDNRYGTGQSCVFALADVLEAAGSQRHGTGGGLVSSLSGATVTVIGFGPVGQGVAQFAVALGSEVRVVDTDPRAELEAAFTGYRTGTADALTADADVVVSATGVAHTISLDLMRSAADRTVFAVAGGIDDEIETARLRDETTVERVDEHLERFTFDEGHSVWVVDDGGCVNITAGEGNPIEIMDLSFAAQLQAVSTLLSGSLREPGLYPLPVDADREIARRALALNGFRGRAGAGNRGAVGRGGGVGADRGAGNCSGAAS
ncbi:adenosylhomocysteinase [Humibacter sp. RRB41]|uniref:adenosylhomocysteinase n=1 Tax=Humibacter sp. RRB41 TaxID=2919946 RepID=UPI001FAA9074|nr:adenosylhomocysteinase [Humibacter sp. RRB41]